MGEIYTENAALNALMSMQKRFADDSPSLTETKKMEDIVDARNKRTVNSVDALADIIKNSTTPEQLFLANNSVNAIGTTISDNPEAYLKNENNKVLLQNKAADSINFMGQMKIANETLNGVRDKQGNLVKKGIFDYKDEDWSKLTIDDIINERRKIDNFTDLMYENPMEEKNPHKFINSYNPEGAMNGVALINGMKEYNKSINAAITAMEENGIIDSWEAPWVRYGDKAKIDSIREERIGEAEGSMTAIRKSVNAIRNHQKKLLNAIASNQINGTDKFKLGSIDISAVQGMKAADEANSPGLYEQMDDEDFIEEKAASMLNLSFNEIIDMYTKEIETYQTLFALEHEKYYKYSGQEFVLGTGVIDRIKKKKEKEALEKALKD